MDKALVTITLDFQSGEDGKPERQTAKLKEGENSGADLRAALGIPCDFQLFRFVQGRRIESPIEDDDTLFIHKGDMFVARRADEDGKVSPNKKTV
jgi:hypothetical protein